MQNMYSIIIVADEKEKYIFKTIKSCLENRSCKCEVILVFNRLKNINLIKNYFKNKIKYFQILKKIKNPIHDQMYKIKKAANKANGDYILLCDGDDFFTKDKVKFISKYLYIKNKILFHDYILNVNNKLTYQPIKIYKKLKIYKILINDWPDKVITSTICIDRKLLINFFLRNNIYAYKYLAIDIKLIIFYLKKINFIKKILLIKNENRLNLDKNYSNFFSKKYFLRRYEQYHYFKKIFSKSNSLEFLLLKILKKSKIL
jgi:hypothetical protein